jgi:membrane protease YdiL (CAAX protease family)
MTRRAPGVAGTLFKHVGLGLAVVVAVPTPWSALAAINLRLSSHVPWAIPAGIAYACLAMAYLNGRGWPRSTAAARRSCFRARPLVLAELNWALIAGLAAVTSLWLLFAASGRLSTPVSQRSEAAWSPIVLLGAIITSAAVTAISEEGGLRGYMQAPLERLIGPVPAIATTSLFFVLIHLSHGVGAIARNGLFYLAAGCVYGPLAYLTQSILPSLLLHFLGDVLAFGLRSSLVQLTSPREASIRAYLVLSALLIAGASVAAFFRLAHLTASKRSHLGRQDAAV